MFYISGINGETIAYDPVRFQARRDVERLHPRTHPSEARDDAAVLELSRALEESIAYSKARTAANSELPPPAKSQSGRVDSSLAVELVDHFESIDSEDEDSAEVALKIMSSPVQTLSPSSYLNTASRLFREQRYRYVPVVSEENRLVGILSDRDLLRAHELAAINSTTNETPRTVSDIMIRNVLSAHPQAEIAAISQVLFYERIGAMSIVNEVGQLAGMVTRSDILRSMVQPIEKSGNPTQK